MLSARCDHARSGRTRRGGCARHIEAPLPPPYFWAGERPCYLPGDGTDRWAWRPGPPGIGDTGFIVGCWGSLASAQAGRNGPGAAQRECSRCWLGVGIARASSSAQSPSTGSDSQERWLLEAPPGHCGFRPWRSLGLVTAAIANQMRNRRTPPGTPVDPTALTAQNWLQLCAGHKESGTTSQLISPDVQRPGPSRWIVGARVAKTSAGGTRSRCSCEWGG